MRLFALALVFAPSVGLANGLSTHVWISEHAHAHVSDPELRAFLADPTNADALVNGTMFPDGGYAIGDGYGEIAHWEPFQRELSAWIAAEHPAPWDEGARRHVAFLLGMASHGMADQVFDSLYMERSRQEDRAFDWGRSFDEATDVVFVAKVGRRGEVPVRWAPYDAVRTLLADRAGHRVERATLEEGQNLAGLAIGFVGLLSTDPDVARDYAGWFPWGGAHLTDADVPGSPPVEARVVGRYLDVVWATLRGAPPAHTTVLETFPAQGALGHVRTSTDVRARLTVVLSHAHRVADVRAADVRVTSGGAVVPTRAWLFYRDDSHVLHVEPSEDWPADADLVLTLGADLASRDGTRLAAPFELAFSTRAPPAPTPPPAPGGCAVGPGASPLALLLALGLTRRRRG